MLKREFDNSAFEGDASIYCESCRKKSQLTTQRTEILSLPPYLVITLNRFYYDRGEQRGSKIFSYVNIYPEINFNETLKENCKSMQSQYELYAIVIHKVTSFFRVGLA